MYHKILVPLDGSALAAQALGHAERIAAETGAEIVLLHVVNTTRTSYLTAIGAAGGSSLPEGTSSTMMHDPSFIGNDPEFESIDQVQDELETLAAEMRQRHFTVTAATDVGDPAHRILEFVDANDIDVVVMSTHGRTGLKRWFMGSVAQKVLHHASCPVLIVRDETEKE